MRALTPGYVYELQSFTVGVPNQFINFHHEEKKWPEQKEPVVDGAKLEGEPKTLVFEGTTNEEVLSMLINRLKFLQVKQPGKENACAITCLQEALLWLNERADKKMEEQTSGSQIKPGAPANQ